MIGKYLATLTREQEDRVLTAKLGAAPRYLREDGCRCLIGCTRDFVDTGRRRSDGTIVGNPSGPLRDVWTILEEGVIGLRFDALCARFGEERIGAIVRNRILANQARRALLSSREVVGV